MKKLLALGLAACLAAGGAIAETIDRQAALDSLVAAELAFAGMAAEKGVREAFLANLAEDSVLFAPDPTPGRELWTRSPVTPALLSWYPIHAEVSFAGDLGYTTGPWERRAKGKDDPEVAYGHFVSVWRRQADGTWKVLFDQGIGHPRPPSDATVSILPAKPARVEASSLPKSDVETERLAAALLAADMDFAKTARRKGEATAYPGVLAAEARLYRGGRQPAVGREAIRAALSGDRLTWVPAGGRIACSGDLGYTYGIVKRPEGGSEGSWVDSDNYLRIWKKQPDGSWKVVLDVLDPRPKPPEKKEPASGT